ncbi:MAG: hypothetical protein VKJ46_15935 [Leptolyngbyaceae bacterium]|nr:hypothetical protein [Leptolyngbyaceae bacterium]
MYPINLSSQSRRKPNTRLPWIILHHQGLIISTVPARFSTRGYAEEHAKLLRQLSPDHHYEVVFNPYDLQ